jgi:hypothetical protein
MFRKARNTKLRYIASSLLIASLLVGWMVMTVIAAPSARADDTTSITASGAGTLAAKTSNVVSFIPAPGSTSANPLFVACTGTTSSPTTTTAPYLITQFGSATITGEVTSNSPGTDNATSVNNPCAPSSSNTYFNQVHAVYTYPSVTVQLANGQSITGGLILTTDGTGTALVMPGMTQVTAGSFGSVVGTGSLAGATGTVERTSVVIQTPSSVSVSSEYWIQLQIPNLPTATIHVSTTNSANAAITGYYTTLWQNGTKISSCYSPCSFTVLSGQTYQVAVSGYGTESFSHWSDGTTTMSHTVNVPSGSTSTISLTAVFTP